MNLRKVESGTELLARLYTRPNVQGIEPFIFGDAPAASSSSSSSSGQIVEIFGPEGVGKTELVLHCAAKVCLAKHKKCEFNGLSSKVVVIDTDFKFSILRLAVILEKQIKHAIEMNKVTSQGNVEKVPCDSCNISASLQEKRANGCSETSIRAPTEGSLSDLGKAKDARRDCKCMVNAKFSVKKQENAANFNEASPSVNFELSNTEIEEIVKESLENVQILKVKNSQQLLASLLSLESSIAGDPTFALLIIDSISAFYWIDRIAEAENSTARKMMPISHAIFQLVDKYGLSCLATSSAFFTGGKNLQMSSNSNRGFMTNCGESVKSSWMNADYLGKSWTSARSKRIVLSRSEILEDGVHFVNMEDKGNSASTEDGNIVHAFCSLTKRRKRYVFHDDFMKDS